MKLADAKSASQMDLFAAKLAKRDKGQSATRNAIFCQGPGCTQALDPLRSTKAFCSNTCRQRAHRRRTKPPPPVLAVVVNGTNADLMANGAQLYIRDGDRVADVTWHVLDEGCGQAEALHPVPPGYHAAQSTHDHGDGLHAHGVCQRVHGSCGVGPALQEQAMPAV